MINDCGVDNNLKKMPNVVLYGLGKDYRQRRNYIHFLEEKGEIKVKGVFSIDNYEVSEIDGWEYYTYEDVNKVTFDYVIILNEASEKQIIDNLLEASIPREKIIPGRVLDLPNFKFNNYIRLKEKKLSIISRTCLGGMLSRTLGLEYLSPFRNMHIDEWDYIKLLNNFDDYMKYDLVCDGEQRFNLIEKMYYPVMRLKDIQIYYPHISKASIAMSDWKERKQKINWSNLFVVNFAENKEVAEAFSQIPFEHKVCFTSFQSDIKDTIYLPSSRIWDTFGESVHLGLCSGLFVDPVKLLLGEKDCMLFERQ